MFAPFSTLRLGSVVVVVGLLVRLVVGATVGITVGLIVGSAVVGFTTFSVNFCSSFVVGKMSLKMLSIDKSSS